MCFVVLVLFPNALTCGFCYHITLHDFREMQKISPTSAMKLALVFLPASQVRLDFLG